MRRPPRSEWDPCTQTLEPLALAPCSVMRSGGAAGAVAPPATTFTRDASLTYAEALRDRIALALESLGMDACRRMLTHASLDTHDVRFRQQAAKHRRLRAASLIMCAQIDRTLSRGGSNF